MRTIDSSDADRSTEPAVIATASESTRNAQLTKLYPQPGERNQPFQKVDYTHLKTASPSSDIPLPSGTLHRVAATAGLLTVPFLGITWLFDVGFGTTTAALQTTVMLFLIRTLLLYGLALYCFRFFIDKLRQWSFIEARRDGWMMWLFALPLMLIGWKTWLSIVHLPFWAASLLTVMTGAGAVLSMTWLLHRNKLTASRRLRQAAIVLLLPYAIGLPVVATQSLRFL